MAKRAQLDTLRSLAYTGISGSYAAVGTSFTVQQRIICITNNTDGDMIFTDDPTNSTGKLFLPAGTFKLFDLTANINPNYDDGFYMTIGTAIYVKQSSSPSKGGVYIEIVYATQ